MDFKTAFYATQHNALNALLALFLTPLETAKKTAQFFIQTASIATQSAYNASQDLHLTKITSVKAATPYFPTANNATLRLASNAHPSNTFFSKNASFALIKIA